MSSIYLNYILNNNEEIENQEGFQSGNGKEKTYRYWNSWSKWLSATFANTLLLTELSELFPFSSSSSLFLFLGARVTVLEKEIPRKKREKGGTGGGKRREDMIPRKSHFLYSVRSGLDPFLQLVGNFFFCFVLTGITFQIKSLYWIFTLG